MWHKYTIIGNEFEINSSCTKGKAAKKGKGKRRGGEGSHAKLVWDSFTTEIWLSIVATLLLQNWRVMPNTPSKVAELELDIVLWDWWLGQNLRKINLVNWSLPAELQISI